MRIGVDGVVELTLTGEATLPPPWEGTGGRWALPGSTPVELLADAARSVGAPCVALAQLGVDNEGREVLADLEALGLLSIAAPDDVADAVVRGIAATLGTTIFAEVANFVGVGLDTEAFLGHRHAHQADAVDAALELATTLVGTTVSAKHSTFVLRARHTSGEAWEPAIVLTGSTVLDQVTPAVVRDVTRPCGGLAMVSAGDAPDAPWCLRADGGRWTLQPLGLSLTPVGLTTRELHELRDVLRRADEPLVDQEATAPYDAAIAELADDAAATSTAGNGDRCAASAGPYEDRSWSLLVRLLGAVEVVDRHQQAVHFERSKTLELIAWLTMHRDRSTRSRRPHRAVGAGRPGRHVRQRRLRGPPGDGPPCRTTGG